MIPKTLSNLQIRNECKASKCILTKSKADLRGQLIKNILYKIQINFSGPSNFYETITTIDFDINEIRDTFLDCAAYMITYLKINDKILDCTQIKQIWIDNFLLLEKDQLKLNQNCIVIKSINMFSNMGYGLVQYIENTFARNVYLYTLFPPNYAHTVFPCFDQPNLKANFVLEVIAPGDWIVISINNHESMINEAPNKNKWIFNQTHKLSTYLFAFAAGHYRFISKDLPFGKCRFYCRSEYYAYLTKEINQISQVVEEGYLFYENFFGIHYPFEKIDFLFCPEMVYAGMENPGMIEITEGYLFYDNASKEKITQRTSTILHEISHMWFGNLVTMKWWDDIWLNESFATFISYHSMSLLPCCKNLSNSNVKFFFYKQGAFSVDDQDRTHPIAQNVEDTEKTTTIFDEITYSKGAAVLKYLFYLIEEPIFRQSLIKYFTEYAWKNADSQDFFKVISKEILMNLKSKIDLDNWIDDWINFPGKNLLVPEQLEITNTDFKLIITQKSIPKIYTKIRNYTIEIGLFYNNEDDKINPMSMNYPLSLNMEQSMFQIPLKEGIKDFGILLNLNDYAYVDIQLDPKSLKYFLRIYNKLDILTRAQVFMCIYKMIFSSNITLDEYFNWIVEVINHEDNIQLFSQYLIYTGKLIEEYLFNKQKAKYGSKIFNVLFSMLCTNQREALTELDESINEKNKIIKDNIMSFAKSNENILQIYDWHQNKIPQLLNDKVSSITRANLFDAIFLRQLLTNDEKDEIINKYLIKNRYYKRLIEGAYADYDKKLDLWELLLEKENFPDSSYVEISYLMRGINNPYQDNIVEIFENKFFNDFPKVVCSNDTEYIKLYFNKMFPAGENTDIYIKKSLRLKEKIKLPSDVLVLMNEKIHKLGISQKVMY